MKNMSSSESSTLKSLLGNQIFFFLVKVYICIGHSVGFFLFVCRFLAILNSSVKTACVSLMQSNTLAPNFFLSKRHKLCLLSHFLKLIFLLYKDPSHLLYSNDQE